jgi:hypothetical protein
MNQGRMHFFDAKAGATPFQKKTLFPLPMVTYVKA